MIWLIVTAFDVIFFVKPNNWISQQHVDMEFFSVNKGNPEQQLQRARKKNCQRFGGSEPLNIMFLFFFFYSFAKPVNV